MDEYTKLVPRGSPSNEGMEALSLPTPVQVLPWEMEPREPHLLDYVIILRKHRWLILSFLLTVVTIVPIGTFRQQPVYEATTRIELDDATTNFFPSPATASYVLTATLPHH